MSAARTIIEEHDVPVVSGSVESRHHVFGVRGARRSAGGLERPLIDGGDHRRLRRTTVSENPRGKATLRLTNTVTASLRPGRGERDAQSGLGASPPGLTSTLWNLRLLGW